MRLAKYLAHAGVASRRASEQIVREGRVTVDGEVVLDPARDVGEPAGERYGAAGGVGEPAADGGWAAGGVGEPAGGEAEHPEPERPEPERRCVVTVDGHPVGGPEQRVVYAVHKPLGVLSSAHDPYDRPTVVSLVPNERRRLYPVGRLDADTTGLILLTNDGELAHRLTHPSFHVPKTYRATVAGGPVGEQALRRLREGVVLGDGPTAPARVRARGSVLEITIHEGRNRQVRRMCEAVGHPVMELRRIAFGPLRLAELAAGAHRRLTDAELASLRALAGSGGAL